MFGKNEKGKGADKATDVKSDAAKSTDAKPEEKKVAGLRVTSKKDGFRRGGRAWSGTTEVPVKDFTKAQINQLKDEHGKMLVVEEAEIQVEARAE